MVEIKPFLMDGDKGEFVIFIMKRDDNPNAYLWVRVNDDVPSANSIRITDFYGLPSYCNHTAEPFYIGDMPEDKLEIAEKVLAEYPKEDMGKLVEQFNRTVAGHMEDEDDFKGYSKWEDEALESALDSADEDGMIYF